MGAVIHVHVNTGAQGFAQSCDYSDTYTYSSSGQPFLIISQVCDFIFLSFSCHICKMGMIHIPSGGF